MYHLYERYVRMLCAYGCLYVYTLRMRVCYVCYVVYVSMLCMYQMFCMDAIYVGLLFLCVRYLCM